MTRSILAAVALLVATPLHAAALVDGVLLVASPELRDPNFSRTVVLVLRHDDSGTLGVVINRQTSLAPGTVFPELTENLGTYAGTLYRGGPVDAARVLFLVRGLAAAVVNGPELVDKVFLSTDADALPDIVRLAEGPANLRLFAGHAAWGAGQLEGEIRAGGWTVVAGTQDLVFSADPPSLWTELSTAAGSGNVVAAARPQ